MIAYELGSYLKNCVDFEFYVNTRDGNRVDGQTQDDEDLENGRAYRVVGRHFRWFLQERFSYTEEQTKDYLMWGEGKKALEKYISEFGEPSHPDDYRETFERMIYDFLPEICKTLDIKRIIKERAAKREKLRFLEQGRRRL